MMMVVMMLMHLGAGQRRRQHRESKASQKDQDQNLSHNSLLNLFGDPKKSSVRSLGHYYILNRHKQQNILTNMELSQILIFA
jgi:hypothetical protein